MPHDMKGHFKANPEIDYLKYFYIYVDTRKFDGMEPQEIQESIDHELAELRQIMTEELIS